MYFPTPRRLAGVLLLFLTAWAAPAQAQESYTIQGTVLDATTQRPLPNVAVSFREAGLRQGTLTDAAGRYTLVARVAPGSYILQYTLIGRGETSRPVTLAAARTVQLEPVMLQESAVQLEGIVVTGAGAPTERKALGNTVATVAGQEISEAPAVATVDQALQGKVTGAVISQNSGAPGGGVSIRLRGTSSILGGAEPLIVVDGVIIDNNSDALISVGANAGRQGAAMANRLADLSPNDIERVEVIKGAAAAALYGSRANNGVIQIFTKRGQQGPPVITFRTEVSASETPERFDLLMSPLAGRGDVVFGGGVVKNVGDPVQRFDIQDEIFRTGYGVDNYLSVSGGREGTSYFLSAGWRDDQGIIQGSAYNKWSGLIKLTQDLTDDLEISASANYLRTETDYIPEGEQAQGVLTTAIFTPTVFNPAFDPTLGRFPYSPILGTNPLDVIENWTTRVNVGRFIGNVQASWRPSADLTFSALAGIDDAREENVFFQPRFSTGANFSGLIQNPVRSVTKYTAEANANHEYTASDALDFVTTLGFRGTSDQIDVVRAGATDIPPGQITVGGATQFASQSIEELNTISGYVQERVAVNDRLFVTGGVNLEAASAFGEDERWQLFPRVGVSYLIDQEPWWEGMRFGQILSTLRLRGSYGETGGQPPIAYAIFDNYIEEPFAGKPGLIPSARAGNPGLEPERQREWEGGFDLAMFSDRLGVEFTYYDQETSNLVLSVPLPSSSGLSSQLQNIGVLSNRGVELALNSINIQRPDLSWSTRLSYAANRNRVEELLTDADTLVVGYLNAVIEGQPVGVFYGGFYERNAQGEIVVNDKGIPQRARDPRTGRFANRIIGDPNPDFTAALSNTVQVGDNLQFDVLLDGRFGGDAANFTRRITEFFGTAAVVEREITGEVPQGFFVLNRARIGNFEEYIEDGSFVKLREASLRYTVDAPWVRRLGTDHMTVRLAGRNLYTWTDYSGLDPEVNLFSASTVARGVDFATTPIPRSVVLGLSFTF